MTEKISSEDFIKAFGSGVKETEHHIITENKGDLISREALKEHKFLSPDNPNATRFYDETTKAYQKGWNDCIDAIIDNAETVEITEEQAIDKLHETGWLPRHDKEMTEKPQGEWITHKVAFHLTCSFCGCNLRALKREVFEGDYDYNFCPNCGAKMMR